jgi:hypothetical protein
MIKMSQNPKPSQTNLNSIDPPNFSMIRWEIKSKGYLTKICSIYISILR